MGKGYVQLFGRQSDSVYIAVVTAATHLVPDSKTVSRAPVGPGTVAREEKSRLTPAYIGITNNRSTNATVTLTLPNASRNRGTMCIVWGANITSNKTLTIAASNTDEASARVLDAKDEHAIYLSDGSQWRFMNAA